jgi:hypothetical protein
MSIINPPDSDVSSNSAGDRLYTDRFHTVMNTDRLLTAAIALCCIFAIGSSASTMGSSVSTSPDDVINVQDLPLPIDPTDAGELKRDAQSKQTDGGQSDSANSQQQRQQQDQQQQSQRQHEQQSQSSAAPKPPDFLDRLLAFLRWLLERLVWILGLLAVAGAVAVGVRFGSRFLPDTDANVADTTTETPPPDPTPSNEVERAWWEVVEHLGIDGARTKTPRECATRAIDAGADPSAVETLTRTFEEVRYGGAPITDERERAARRGADGVVGR